MPFITRWQPVCEVLRYAVHFNSPSRRLSSLGECINETSRCRTTSVPCPWDFQGEKRWRFSTVRHMRKLMTQFLYLFNVFLEEHAVCVVLAKCVRDLGQTLGVLHIIWCEKVKMEVQMHHEDVPGVFPCRGELWKEGTFLWPSFFFTCMCVCRFKQIVQVVIYDFQCSKMRLDIFLLWCSPVLAPCFITWASQRDSRPSKNKPAHLSYEWMSMCGSVSGVGGFNVLCYSHLPQNFHMAMMPPLQSTLKYTHTADSNFQSLTW